MCDMLKFLFYDYKLYIHMISSSSSTGIFTRYIDTERMKYLLFFCFFPHSVFLFWVLSVCVFVHQATRAVNTECAENDADTVTGRLVNRQNVSRTYRLADRRTSVLSLVNCIGMIEYVWPSEWQAFCLSHLLWVCECVLLQKKKQTFKAGSQSVSQPVIQFLVNFFRMYSLKYTQSHTDTHLYVHK